MIFAAILVVLAFAASEIGAGPTCPARDGALPTYIPHEDCTKFWECSNGRPYLFDCPADLHFNPQLNVCDWPDQAGCDGSGGVSVGDDDSGDVDSGSDGDDNGSGGDDNGSGGDDNGSGGDDGGSGGDSSSSSSESESNEGSGECPAVDGPDSVYFPDADCGRFWQCSNGVAYQQICPDGLHFNPSLNVCDWPDNAGCNGSGGDDDSSSSSSSESEGDGSGEENGSEGGDDNGGDDGGSGTGGSGEDNGGNGSGENGSDDGGSGTGGSGEGSGECPSVDGEYPVYFPDEDCGRFWQCSNGVAYRHDCPDGLHFNTQLNVCDWPNAAGCGSGEGGGSGQDDPEEPEDGDDGSSESNEA